MIPQILPSRYLMNPRADRLLAYGPDERSILNDEANEAAYREISSWDSYAVTPLVQLPGLARGLGVGSVWLKDEGKRLGLGSFKALGGAYGVFRVLAQELERSGLGPLSSVDLLTGKHQGPVRGTTVACASLGNHGLSVAWGARLFGCRAVVFLPRGLAPDRVSAIRDRGAEIVYVDGSYDDAVAAAEEESRNQGWFVVSDMACPGYEEVPRYVMQGYTVLIREVLDQMPGHRPPTHVFVQAGVGGLAGAVAGYLWERYAPERPVVVVVEPAEADGLFETALYDRISPSLGSLDTGMSCLACRDPSTLAWRILRTGADAFLTIPDHGAQETVTYLARGAEGAPPVLTQPSGAAGLAGLITAAFEPTLSERLNLGENSVVLVFGSEGPAQGQPTLRLKDTPS